MAAAKKKEKKPIMSGASSGHITKLKQSIFHLSISMDTSHTYKFVTPKAIAKHEPFVRQTGLKFLPSDIF